MPKHLEKPSPVKMGALVWHAKSLTDWIESFRPSLPKLQDDEMLQAGRDALLVTKADADAERKKDDEEWNIRSHLAPILDHLLWAVGMLASGETFRKTEETTGLSFTKLRACAAVDKPGFGRVWELAMRLREENRLARNLDLLAERAKDGTERPVVMRNGRDHDELHMVKVKSDNLLIKAVEAGASRARESEKENATVNVGQAITYNIQAPQFILKNEPLNLVETNPLEGLKKSLE